mmetsp:Transcript_122610/g.358078  ORF Transcript_122610/g.358078 Transcript_122610/m.358078 type:complete len:381 (-) Transcript_122610:434-1576(-)
MGVSSPFIGAISSPALRKSRQATPELLCLEAFDDFNNIEGLEICPPQFECTPEQKAKALCALDITREVAEPPPKLERTRTVPAWPSHWPDYTHDVYEANTFLDLPEPDRDFVVPQRRRACSDFTGMREMEKEMDLRAEDLFEPLPEPALSPEEFASASQQDMSWGQQCFWLVPDEVSGEWAMTRGSTSQDPSQMCPPQDGSQAWPETERDLPRLPLLPPEAEAFKPKWIYGSSWPFNCAPTTLILDNLPEDLTQPELLAVLDASGFCGLYDFAFLPACFRTGRNQGQAIVNLKRHSYGLALAARAEGFADWGASADGSHCEVKWSLPLQGIAEHIEQYRNHPAMHESVPEAFRPALFVDGWQVPFPPPTKWIRSPRLGHR